MQQTNFLMCSYIQKMTLDLIEALKRKNIVHNAATTPTYILNNPTCSKIDVLQKLAFRSNQRFPLIRMAWLGIVFQTVPVVSF